MGKHVPVPDPIPFPIRNYVEPKGVGEAGRPTKNEPDQIGIGNGNGNGNGNGIGIGNGLTRTDPAPRSRWRQPVKITVRSY
ncbi:MAG: hypothetical protein HYV07_23410 [Deltaproteobacteria bacterium]|nr:hypothetical protein [Deltaproteobacteria bacterium]